MPLQQTVAAFVKAASTETTTVADTARATTIASITGIT
jgi:hypothetical protein